MLREKTANGKTLVEAFIKSSQGDQGIVFIGPKGDQYVSYRDLYQRAVTILFNLQQKGVQPGNELLFQVEDNFDFTAIFWGCLLGGMIPVPLTIAKTDNYRFKLFKVWKILKAPYLVISQNAISGLEKFAVNNRLENDFAVMKQRKLLIEDLEQVSGEGMINYPDEQDIAFIQFSSGSTNDPKGVVLTHKNLMVNISDIDFGFRAPIQGDRLLSWMPLTHDMGLIGMHLYPTVMGYAQFLMPPELFVRHPLLWLEKISEYKASLICSPNFGYKHLLKFYHLSKCKSMDLSSVRIIVNGAEPISANVCHRFLETLAPWGLKKNVMFPAYGLAEACVAVSFSEPGQDFSEVHLDRTKLDPGAKVVKMNSNSLQTITFVETGKPLPHCRLRIVNDSGIEVEPQVVGHIQIKGENVTSGYYNNPEATQQAITVDGWLSTGDLGFLNDGRLVIIGRSKDIIFVNGVNFYAHDLEFSCDWLEGFDSREIAACGVYNPDLQMDDVLCFVVFRGKLREFLPLRERIKKHLVQQIGIGITQIIPVKSIPVTTSGKKQRYRLKEAYQQGKYDEIIQELLDLQTQQTGA
ncbi:MAG TPA: AMP-binding protein [Bacillota bacterium]